MRAFLERHAEPRRGTFETWQSRYPDREGLERAKDFQRKRADAGLAGLHWPEAYGGREAPAIFQVILAQEESALPHPSRVFRDRPRHVHADLVQLRDRGAAAPLRAAALRGDEVWCQLFRSPAPAPTWRACARARSAMATIGSINGQKIWTSGAHWADHAILVTRSDPKTAKHKGLTFFFLSMKSPGIETRRIKQISGQSHFNEVYLNRRPHPRQPAAGRRRPGLGCGHHHAHERAPDVR